MQLPEIPTGPVQNEESAGYRNLAAAQQQFGGVVEQGLYALHSEMVKSQSNEAGLKLSERLGALRQGLDNKKAFDRDELEQILGKEEFDKIPAEVRDRPPEPVLDEQGNQVMDEKGFPRTKPGAIPTWQVGHLVFDKTAATVIDDSSAGISGSGWQDRFKQAARGDVLRQRADLVARWTEQAGQHLANDRARQALRAAYAGNYDTAGAIVDGSLEVLGEEGQAKLRSQVQTVQVLKPIEDSLIHWRSDPGSATAHQELVEASKALADDARTGILEPQRRAALDGQIRSALDETAKGAKTHEAAGLVLSVIQANPDPRNPYTVNPKAAQAALAKLFQPGGKFADKPELYFEASSLLSKQVSDQNQATKASYDGLAGAAIGQYLGMDQRGVPHPSYANITPTVRADLQASGEDGQKLLHQMLEWDKSEERHRREMRNIPSDAEEGRAFRIERSMATRPGEWRAMSGADQMAVLAGLKPVPGEPDAPAVAVSAKDVPGLSQKAAALSAAVAPVFVTDPAKIALEEATGAFPDLKNPKKSSAQARVALAELTDKISALMTAEKNRTGKEPDTATVRAEAKRLMATVEVRDTFMRVFHTTKKITRQEAEQQGLDYTDPNAPPAPKAAPEPSDTSGVDFHGKRLRTQADVDAARGRLSSLVDDKFRGDDARKQLEELSRVEAQIAQDAAAKRAATAPPATRKVLNGKTYEKRADGWYEAP